MAVKSKKRPFLIEIVLADKSIRQFMVEAETYEHACSIASVHVPAGTWKLVAIFEKMETDKAIMQRIA